MKRFIKIFKGKECQVAGHGQTLTVKRCRDIKTKNPISTNKLLSELGIRSL